MVFCNKESKLGDETLLGLNTCHNPYFNRWFSAIYINNNVEVIAKKVTILILIDGFLQYLCNTKH